MKIIIEHGDTKREINGSFAICGSRNDLQNFVNQLQHHLSDDSWCYGWTEIYAPLNRKGSTPPVAWE